MAITKEDLNISQKEAIRLLDTKQQTGTEQRISYLAESFGESSTVIWSLLEKLAEETH